MGDKHLKLLNGEGQRGLDLGHLLDRAFWALLTFVVWLGVDQLRDMGKSVSELNAKMAVVVEQVAGHERRIDILEDVSRHSVGSSKSH